MQAAVRDAIGPKELAEVLHRLRDLAVGGDVAAARVLLDRVMGRARVEESAAALIELPSIETAGGCSEALSRILKAASVGEIDSTAAAQLAGLVDLARRSIETLALEERIDALEDRLSGA